MTEKLRLVRKVIKKRILIFDFINNYYKKNEDFLLFINEFIREFLKFLN